MSGPADPTRRDIRAPADTLAWSSGRGWYTDREDVIAAHDIADEPIWLVNADGRITDVVGPATIADLMLTDRRVLAVRRECDELREILTQLAETAVDLLAARAPGGGS